AASSLVLPSIGPSASPERCGIAPAMTATDCTYAPDVSRLRPHSLPPSRRREGEPGGNIVANLRCSPPAPGGAGGGQHCHHLSLGTGPELTERPSRPARADAI